MADKQLFKTKKGAGKNSFLETPVDIICTKSDLRPAMKCVYFKDGFLYATDAHIAIKQSLKLHGLEQEEINALDGKLISSEGIKALKKMDGFYIDEKGIVGVKGQNETRFNFVDERFPDLEAVLPKSSQEATEFIGINPELYARVGKVLISDEDVPNFFRLDFYGTTRAIKATTKIPDTEQIAIIMPNLVS